MAEWVVEAPLAVRTPWKDVLLDWRADGGSGHQGTSEELVRIVDEELYPRACAPSLEWACLARVVRVDLMEEERGSTDLKPGDATEVPEHPSSQSVLVPGDSARSVGNDEHDRDGCRRRDSSNGPARRGVICRCHLTSMPSGGTHQGGRARTCCAASVRVGWGLAPSAAVIEELDGRADRSMTACSGPPAWQTGAVQRRPVTIELDGNLVEAARSVAQRSGVPEDELYERVLREVLAREFGEFMDEVAAFQAANDVSLTDEEAMDMAVSELQAMRAERRNAS